MVPEWLHILAIAHLAFGGFCALAVTFDLTRAPQKMWVMNIVWPVTALFGSALVLFCYFRYGRRQTGDDSPVILSVIKGTLHCGAGCTLGDIVAEWLGYFVPTILVWIGWHNLFSERLYAAWILDYLWAFAFGIAFQYFAITPLKQYSFRAGIAAALKADAASLTAWQVGMYGTIGLVHFYVFPEILGTPLKVASPEFWFFMQLAMLVGFATSFPVNWWLINRGIKEAM